MKENQMVRWLVMLVLITTVSSSDFAALQLEINPNLQKAANKINKQVVNVKPDGNCLYYSLLGAWKLIDKSPTFNDQMDVRKHIYKEFDTHQEFYWVEYNQSRKRFATDGVHRIKDILVNEAWGIDDISVKGFAKSLKIPIAVYEWKNGKLKLNEIFLENGDRGLRFGDNQDSEGYWDHTYTRWAKKYDPIEKFDRTIFLVHVNGNHFMYLKPLNEKKKIEKIKEEEEEKENLGIAANKTSSKTCRNTCIILVIICAAFGIYIIIKKSSHESDDDTNVASKKSTEENDDQFKKDANSLTQHHSKSTITVLELDQLKSKSQSREIASAQSVKNIQFNRESRCESYSSESNRDMQTKSSHEIFKLRRSTHETPADEKVMNQNLSNLRPIVTNDPALRGISY